MVDDYSMGGLSLEGTTSVQRQAAIRKRDGFLSCCWGMCLCLERSIRLQVKHKTLIVSSPFNSVEIEFKKSDFSFINLLFFFA
jgi:hypothetical protein